MFEVITVIGNYNRFDDNIRQKKVSDNCNSFYKRYDLNPWYENIINQPDNYSFILSIGHINRTTYYPVSYTHLDVYKRQI